MGQDNSMPDSGAGHTDSPAPAIKTPVKRREFLEMTGTPDLITKQMFGERTSMSVRSVEKLLAERKIPCVRLTRKIVRIPWEEALEHLRRNYTINAR